MPKLTLDGDARGAIKAAADMRRAVEKAGKSAGAVTGKLDKMTRAARSIREANNPQLRYNRLLSKTAELVNRNKLSLNQATQAAVRYRRAMSRALAARGAGGGVAGGGKGFAAGAGGFIGGRVTSGLAGYATVAAVVGVAMREVAKIQSFENARNEAQRTLALPGQRVSMNLAPYDAADREDLKSLIRELSLTKGLPREQVSETLATTISATGVPKRAAEVMKVSLDFSRDPKQIEEIAGGIGDIMFNAADEVTTALQAAGFLAGVQSKSRITTAGKVGTTLGPVLGAYRKNAGTTAKTGAQTYVAIGLGSADKMGNITATAVTSLPDRYHAFFSKPAVRSQFDPQDIDTFDEQHAILMGDRYLAIKARWLELIRTSFKAKVRPGFNRLYTGDPEVLRAYRETGELLESPEKMEQVALKTIKATNLTRAVITDQLAGGITSAKEDFNLRTDAKLSTEEGQFLIDLATVIERKSFTKKGIEKITGYSWDNLSRAEGLAFAEDSLRKGKLLRGVTSSGRAAESEFDFIRNALPMFFPPRSRPYITGDTTTRQEKVAEESMLEVINRFTEAAEATRKLIIYQTEQADEANEIRREQEKIAREQKDATVGAMTEAQKTNEELARMNGVPVSPPNKAE